MENDLCLTQAPKLQTQGNRVVPILQNFMQTIYLSMGDRFLEGSSPGGHE